MILVLLYQMDLILFWFVENEHKPIVGPNVKKPKPYIYSLFLIHTFDFLHNFSNATYPPDKKTWMKMMFIPVFTANAGDLVN